MSDEGGRKMKNEKKIITSKLSESSHASFNKVKVHVCTMYDSVIIFLTYVGLYLYRLYDTNLDRRINMVLEYRARAPWTAFITARNRFEK